MKHILIIALCMVFMGLNVPDMMLERETLSFDVIYKDEPIGILKAERKKSSDRTLYTSSTHIKTRILLVKKVNVRYNFEVAYEIGKLQQSKVVIKVNKGRREEILTEKEDGKYKVTLVDEDRFFITESIDHSTIMLYFEEPEGFEKTFSEQTGNFNAIRKIKEGVYIKRNEKGRENTYHYENGKLSYVKVDGGIIEFEIRAR